MLNKNIAPTGMTYTALLDSCANAADQHSNVPFRKAQGVIESLNRKSLLALQQSVPPPMNRYHVNAFIKCASRHHQWHAVFADTYQQMCTVTSPLRSQSEELPAVASDHLDEFKTADAGKLMRERLNGNMKDEPTVDHFDKENVSTPHITSFLSRIRPDVRTYTLLLSACATRGGDAAFSDAMQIWQHVKQDIELSQAHKPTSAKPSNIQKKRKSRFVEELTSV